MTPCVNTTNVYYTFETDITVASDAIAGLLIKDDLGNQFSIRLGPGGDYGYYGVWFYKDTGAQQASADEMQGAQFTPKGTHTIKVQVQERRVISVIIDGSITKAYHMDPVGNSDQFKNFGLSRDASKIEIYLLFDNSDATTFVC